MVLPILFILIVVFGHGENRFRSAFLLFLYTLAGSLPMLLSILTIYSWLDSTDFQLISLNEISLESQKWLWVLLPFSKEKLPYKILNNKSNYFKNNQLKVIRHYYSLINNITHKPKLLDLIEGSLVSNITANSNKSLSTSTFIKVNKKK